MTKKELEKAIKETVVIDNVQYNAVVLIIDEYVKGILPTTEDVFEAVHKEIISGGNARGFARGIEFACNHIQSKLTEQ